MNWDGHTRPTGALYEAHMREKRQRLANGYAWTRGQIAWLATLITIIVVLVAMLFVMPANADSEGAVTPGTLAARSMLSGCTFTTVPPTAASGQQFAIQCDQFGGVKSSVYPAAATAVMNSSGNVAASAAVATLPGVAGKTTFICGFTMSSSGSTGALVVSPTIAGVVSGTMTYTYTTIAGATLANPVLSNNFSPCLPASAANTAIVVTLPSLGGGNTNATTVAWGFQQ